MSDDLITRTDDTTILATRKEREQRIHDDIRRLIRFVPKKQRKHTLRHVCRCHLESGVHGGDGQPVGHGVPASPPPPSENR